MVKSVKEAKEDEVSRKRDKSLKTAVEKRGAIALLGELLKRQREHLNLSQKEIGDRLGYQYFSFISMIENGACKIPFNRMADVQEAYGFEKEFILSLIKITYPDVWKLLLDVKSKVKSLNNSISSTDMDKLADAQLKQHLKDFRLSDVKLNS